MSRTGSETTLSDALKCVLENVEFRCHQPTCTGQLCNVWGCFISRVRAHRGRCPWPFSDEVDTIGAKAEPTSADLESLDVLVRHLSSIVTMSARQVVQIV